jgi:putative membrane protein
MDKTLHCLLAVAAAGALGACSTPSSVAVDTTATPPAAVMGASAAPSSATDRDFATTAAVSGLVEIAASQLALTHSNDPQVLSFARTMIQDHTAADNELAAWMRAHGMSPPAQLPKTRVDQMTEYGMRSGADFDRLYVMRAGVQDHQAAIAAFQRQMPALSDPGLKDWAAKTLPVMQHHLAMAQDIAGRMAG